MTTGSGRQRRNAASRSTSGSASRRTRATSWPSPDGTPRRRARRGDRRRRSAATELHARFRAASASAIPTRQKSDCRDCLTPRKSERPADREEVRGDQHDELRPRPQPPARRPPETSPARLPARSPTSTMRAGRTPRDSSQRSRGSVPRPSQSPSGLQRDESEQRERHPERNGNSPVSRTIPGQSTANVRLAQTCALDPTPVRAGAANAAGRERRRRAPRAARSRATPRAGSRGRCSRRTRTGPRTSSCPRG